ncbi:MAG: mechanosensitive ion channel domain-containing protein, partial [Pseudomonadota bacterium]
GQIGLPRLALGLSVVFLIYSFVNRFITNKLIIALTNWVAVPVALLHVFGWLDDVTSYLDGLSLQLGNIKVSAYAFARTVFFGIILFWLGRISNSTGKRVIRARPDLDIRTREIATKLFEIGLFVLIALILLQVMGINLTTLAVFGGALGVGLGFGLQQIASNFISGIIILLDKSITIGDYIELDDGRAGRLRELSMRSATLETYDGKDIMVPNETFITSTFTNWTHHNEKQRYSLNFSVAYKTDLPVMFDIVRDVVASHPKVLSGDHVPIAERPDAEIESFGDSGINILVEFWMEGIDDGENRVGADLLMMIWTALKENGIEIPFPQREVSILNQEPTSAGP